MNTGAPDFGTFLRTWRKAKGLYKKEAASFLRIPLRTYEVWEWGIHIPSEIVRTTILARINELNASNLAKPARLFRDTIRAQTDAHQTGSPWKGRRPPR